MGSSSLFFQKGLLVVVFLVHQLHALPTGPTACSDCSTCLGSSISHVLISGNFTAGDFQGCSTITEVTLGSTVTSIPNDAFNGATSLSAVHFDGVFSSGLSVGSKAFTGTALTSVTLPVGLTTFSNAFSALSTLTSISIPETVTAIDASAFSGSDNLANLTFSGSSYAMTIGDNAFTGSKLTSIVLPSGVTSFGSAFQGASVLTSISIPSTVTSIASHAFAETALASVTFTGATFASGLSLADNAFSSLPNLATVDFGSANFSGPGLVIGNSAFAGLPSLTGTFTLPKGITSLGGGVFSGSGVTSPSPAVTLVLPSDMTVVHSFVGFIGLKTVVIPHTVTSISDDAFNYASGLSSLTFTGDFTANGLTIGNNAFKFTALTALALPDGLTTIGTGAFQGITTLTSLSIPNSVTSIGSFAFYSCILNTPAALSLPTSITTIPEKTFYEFKGLTSVTIFSGVTSIGNFAFHGASLTTLTFSGDFTTNKLTIGKYAFKSTAISTLVLPNGLTTIGANAFEGTSGLLVVTIPTSVTSIGNSAFYFASSLATLTMSGTFKGLSIGDGAFYVTALAGPLVLPDGLVRVGEASFQGLTQLTSLTIPDSLTTISTLAFYGSGPTSGIGRCLIWDASVTRSVAGDAFDNFMDCSSKMPSVSPSMAPTISPSEIPSEVPSAAPTVSDAPSVTPSRVPTIEPSSAPSATPSVESSATPSAEPSTTPSVVPTAVPSATPNAAPSATPSEGPTAVPSATPNAVPSVAPSQVPTATPSVATSGVPSVTPSVTPSVAPTTSPSQEPTATPSATPSVSPSEIPSQEPSATPSIVPSQEPSVTPSAAPNQVPSMEPSALPSQELTVVPSATPTVVSTTTPTQTPSFRPSCSPSVGSSQKPSTNLPTVTPSIDIFFDTTLNLDNVNSPTLDEGAKATVCGAVTTILKLADQKCLFANQTTLVATRRQLTPGFFKIKADVRISASTGDFTDTESDSTADNLYDKLTDLLTVATTNTVFADTLQDLAENFNTTASFEGVTFAPAQFTPYTVVVYDTDNDAAKGLSDGALAGIVIGAVVAAFLIVFAVWYGCRGRRGEHRAQKVPQENGAPQSRRSDEAPASGGVLVGYHSGGTSGEGQQKV